MNQPLISIVTIVFNGEKYISKTIESVLNQEYIFFEYIIIDGGSTDATVEIIKKYELKITFWLSEKDNGLADAMNKSIKYCKGEHIMFIHADDILEPFALSKLVYSLSTSPKRWAMGFYKYINSEGRIIKEDSLKDFTHSDMMLRNVVRHQATIIPLEVFTKVGFENYKYALDYMFFLKIWEMLGPPMVVKKHLTYFRLDGTNLSSNFYASIKDEMKVRKDYRRLKKQEYKLLFDYTIYFLRVAKIFFYHSRTQSVK